MVSTVVYVMAIFLRFDNSENEFNMKARLKDQTKFSKKCTPQEN